jgi:hypothetical protein
MSLSKDPSISVDPFALAVPMTHALLTLITPSETLAMLKTQICWCYLFDLNGDVSCLVFVWFLLVFCLLFADGLPWNLSNRRKTT